MVSPKDIILRVVPAKIANDFVRKHHYSKKIVPNSKLHFGAFLNGVLHGVMSYGPSINKKGTINLVKGTGWNNFIELNRMAFDEQLPKNSESRLIAVSLKLLRRHAPQIKWVISFADGTQCGDGAIYRASGFQLVGYAVNQSIRINPSTGEKTHIIQAHHKMIQDFRNWQAIPGFQFKYVYLLDKSMELAVKPLPFSVIKELGAEMYKGEKISR